MSKKLDRKLIEINRKPIYLRKLLHGKEIREAANALECQRLMLNEDEILLGAKLSIDWRDSSTAYLVSRRLETDNEYAERIERQRLAEEQRVERERQHRLKEAVRLKQQEDLQRETALKNIQSIMNKHGISVDQLKK